MKTKILIWMFVLVALSSFAYSASAEDNLVLHYNFSSLTDLSGNGNDGTNNGATAVLEYPTYNISGDSSPDSFDFDGNDYIEPNPDSSLDFIASQDYVVSFWYKRDTSGSKEMLYAIRDSSSHFFEVKFGSDDRFKLEITGGTRLTSASQATITDTNWHQYLVYYNSTDNKGYLYIDGEEVTYNTQQAGVNVHDVDTTTGNFDIGRFVGGDYLDGTLDEVRIYNASLNSTQIGDLYNYGTTAPVTATAKINVSDDSYPQDNTQLNDTTINFNTTVNASINFNCSLYINDTFNGTSTEYINGTDVFVDFDRSLNSGNYTYYISCFNSTDSTSQVANTTTKQFYVDIVNPAINRLSLDTLVINGKNITGQFNLTDDFNLFSYNMTIDGNLIDNKTNLNTLSYLLNLSYNTSSLANGEHTLKVTTADGHTAYKIDKFDKVKNGLFNDKLEFEDKQKSYNIYAKDKSIFDGWTAEKKRDRYTFEYTPADKTKPYYDFIVETDERLHIIENDKTPWGSWLIAGNKWIDFDMPYEDSKVKIKRLSPYKAEVRVSNIKNPERMVFNSIGELNIISEEYTFYTTSLNVTFESPISELTTTEMTLRVDKPATSTITDTEASLTYNNTDITLTNQEFSGYDLYTASYQTPSIAVDSKNFNFSWQINITDDSGNSTFYYNSSQNVFNIAIDNCSTYNTTALNFTIIYPNGTDATSADMAGHFKTYIDEFNDNVPFNLTWAGGNDYGVCINPAYAEYTAYAQIVYSASGFDEKTYYFNNVSLDNTTNFINLYLSDNITTSDVTFNVIDQDDSPISEVFIKIQEYEVETDSAETVEIIKTDNSGEAVSNSIILYDQKYKFILEQNGEIIFNSDPTIINSLTKTFRINTEDDYFEEYNKVVNTFGEVYFTNSTKRYTFTFSEGTGEATNGCLRVIRRTINGDTELDDSCISSNSGTLNYIITEDTNDNTYIGTGYIILNGQEYVIDSEEVNFGSRFKTFGTEGILMTFFIFVTLATIGISSLSPAIALFMAMVSLAVAVILGIFFMSWTAMIVIIILGGIALYKVTRN